MLMFLRDAIEKALPCGLITRQAWKLARILVRKEDGYIILLVSTSFESWRPLPEDIMAEDWMVCDETALTEPKEPEKATTIAMPIEQGRGLRIATVVLALISLVLSITALLLRG